MNKTLGVCWTYSTSAYGCYGWNTRSQRVETVEEGLALVAQKFTGTTYEAELVMTDHDSHKRHILARRKAKQETKIYDKEMALIV